ncbi:MAG: PilZ domain-containing protein [Deltaproteobacteria bacterium]|nr:PilZ domain-containing protein [Deltaproteobacteria bacterium]
MDRSSERRTEPRVETNRYYSVEISIEAVSNTYQFKIWDMSSQGLCLVARDDSELIEHLKVGDIIKMKYYSFDATIPAEYLKTKIAHVTKNDNGTFKGHSLIGLSILEGE